MFFACKIIGQTLKHHPRSGALTLSASVPIIYMQQFWHSVYLGDSKDILRNTNNQEFFVKPLEFLTIAQFLDIIGYEVLIPSAARWCLLLTEAHKVYDVAYKGVVVPMMQPSTVVSNQETYRTLSSSRSPKPKRTLKKKGEQVSGEFSEPKKMLKLKIKTKKSDLVTLVPTAVEIEKDQLTEAEQVSYALAVSAKEAEESENVKLVKEVVFDQEVDKLLEAIMSLTSSAFTYTSVYTDSEPGRVFWGADKELSDGGSPRVIVYGYDGLHMLSVAPPSPDYIHGPEEP
nr:hypothetical protein [Tanacetum cinerariifolium]